MANNILIEFLADKAGFDDVDVALNSAAENVKNIKTQMGDLQKKINNPETAQVIKNQYIKEYDNLSKSLSTAKKSVEDLSNAQKQMKGDILLSNTTMSAKQLNRELKDLISGWTDFSKEGTKTYNALLQKSGELTDRISDMQREIKNIASDTGTFDTVLEGTQLIAGGFSVAQGAAALFGASSEDLQKVMVKLQSAIAITTGLQQVQNALQKESNIMKGIGTFQTMAAAKAEAIKAVATESGTKATLGATVAQKAWNFAASVNPYVLLAMAIISVVGAIALFSSGADSASEKSKKYKSTIDDLRFATKEARDEHDKFKQSIRDIQVDIDVAIGKTTKYQAELVKIANALKDKLDEIDKEVEEKLNSISDSYDGFWNKLWRSTVNVFKGDPIGTATLKVVKEQQIKTKKIVDEGNAKKINAQIETGKLLENKTAENNAKLIILHEENLKRNEDLDNENVKGIQGTLKKIETERKREIKAAKEKADEINDLNRATGKAEEDNLVNLTEINKKYDNQAAEARKAESVRIKSENDKRREELTKNERDLQDAKLAAMKDGEEKEIASIQNALKNRLAEIKVNSEAEIALRAQLEANAETETQKVREKFQKERENSQRESELSIINVRLYATEKGSLEERNIRIEALNKQAEIDMAAAMQSVNTEEWKAAKIKEINAKLLDDTKNLNIEYIQSAEDRSKKEVLIVTQQYEQGKISKLEYENQLSDIGIKALQDEIKERIAIEGESSENVLRLRQELSEKNIAIAKEEKQRMIQLLTDVLDSISQIADSMFAIQKNRLDAQTEEINHYYDTEIARAGDNKQKQEQLEQQKAAALFKIKQQQAQQEKNQAKFNAVMNLAQGIIRIWAQSGVNTPLAIITTALLTGVFSAQMAAINSKSIPKYAKGRKKGKGEFAMVGEQGAEMMWIPSGASIMPANDTIRALSGDRKMFDKWDIPRIEPKFTAPTINHQLISKYNREHINEDKLEIDYERLGKSVAKYTKYPKQRDVSVIFDKSGLSVTQGNTTTHYLNSKYKV